MWIVLKGDLYQGISKRNLLVFMLAIFGIKNVWKKTLKEVFTYKGIKLKFNPENPELINACLLLGYPQEFLARK